MLILTSQVGSSISIGDKIKIRICAVQGNQVKFNLEVLDASPIHCQDDRLELEEDTPR